MIGPIKSQDVTVGRIVIKLSQIVSKLSTFAVNFANRPLEEQQIIVQGAAKHIVKLWSSNIDLVSSPARVISFKYQQHD